MGDQARANAGGMPRPANAAKRSRTQGIHYNRRIDAHLRFARTRAPFALGGANARPHRRPVRAGVLQQARLRFLVCLSPFTPICRIDRPPGCLLNPEAQASPIRASCGASRAWRDSRSRLRRHDPPATTRITHDQRSRRDHWIAVHEIGRPAAPPAVRRTSVQSACLTAAG